MFFNSKKHENNNIIWYNNNIISDVWQSYNWLQQNGYYHIVHEHGRQHFGHGSESTSYIESILGQLKRIIAQIYNSLKPENFIYYLKEIEFRFNVRNKNSKDKIKEIQTIIEYCYSTCKLNFVTKDDLVLW